MKKLRSARRFGASAAVFMAAVVQYLVKEVLQMSVVVCRLHVVTSGLIIPRHLRVAFQGDEDLFKLVSSLLFTEMGMPRIQAILAIRPKLYMLKR